MTIFSFFPVDGGQRTERVWVGVGWRLESRTTRSPWAGEKGEERGREKKEGEDAEGVHLLTDGTFGHLSKHIGIIQYVHSHALCQYIQRVQFKKTSCFTKLCL